MAGILGKKLMINPQNIFKNNSQYNDEDNF